MRKPDAPEFGLGSFPVDENVPVQRVACLAAAGVEMLLCSSLSPSCLQCPPPQPLSCMLNFRMRSSPPQGISNQLGPWRIFADKAWDSSQVSIVSLSAHGVKWRVHHKEGGGVLSASFPSWRQSSLLVAKGWKGTGYLARRAW